MTWGCEESAPTGRCPQRLEEELRLHKCSTRECIEQYYLDKLKQVAHPPGVGTQPRPWTSLSPAHWATGLSTEVPGAEPVRAPECPLPLRGS